MPGYDPLLHKLVHGTDDERKYICESRIDLFALVYFSDFFKFPMAPFHIGFFEDLSMLERGELTEALWIAFRESAKTSDAKIGVAHAICYQKRKYILWGSYDKDNAEASLFDIVTEFQTNPKLLHDFGSLYTEKRGDDEVKMKRVAAFITANDIKVEAISTGESTRGKIYNTNRPDMYVYDDIENDKTKISMLVTKKIINHVEEARAGMAPQSSMLILGNYISEVGVVEYLKQVIARNPKGKMRQVDAIMKGKPAWPGKYVLNDQQLLEEGNTGKVSLETVRKRLGELSWRENMMNDPAGVSEPFFNRRKVDLDLGRVVAEPIEDLAGFRVYHRYNPSHRYAAGADTSMGVGLDSCASAFIDFSTIPKRVTAVYDNNHIAPDLFAHELKKEGEYFGGCLVAPEANGESGGACVNTFKEIYKNIHITRQQGRMVNSATKKVGWVTNSSSKAEMFFRFKSDYEDGKIEILDAKLLREMRQFTVLDIKEDTAGAGITRHFDLLTAACIANMLEMFATFTKPKPRAIQRGPYESPSIEQESRKLNPTRSGFKQGIYQPPGLE